MRRQLMCGLFTVLVVVAASAAGVTGVQASPRIARTHGLARATRPSSHSAGDQLWAERYGANGYEDTARSMAVSPDGSTVFVTGETDPPSGGPGLDYATIAYSTATGAQLWLASYNDPYNGNDWASSLTVSPDGSTVYVTGSAGNETGGVLTYDMTTFAYNAATGVPRWVASYNGPSNKDDRATGIALSHGGSTVFVTGYSTGKTSGHDYETVAYNASTGARLWANRYNGPGNGDDRTTAVGVSLNDKRVFVTGYSPGKTAGCNYSGCWDDYATVANSTATGAQLWVKRYNGPGNQGDEAFALAVSPNAGALYVTGTMTGKPPCSCAGGAENYKTIAYSTITGARLWSARYTGPAQSNIARSVAVSPNGGTVFVTGESLGVKSNFDYLTVAYNAATGAQRWAKRYNGPGNNDDRATSTVVSPSGNTVYVTGHSTGKTTGQDYTTIAYNAATGAWQWGTSYSGPAGNDDARAVAVSPTNGRVFVTGTSAGTSFEELDFATVAYACCASSNPAG
jgi:hypothetical protein